MEVSNSKLKSLAIEIAGWLLVAIGIAALVLPGPGLLALFAGLTLLSTRYEWAERRLAPVRKAALQGARDSMSSVPRVAASSLLALGLIAAGVMWGISPSAPSWWPLQDKYWLVGGWGTGSTLIISGILAGAMIVYSYTHFRTSSAQHQQ